MLILKKGHQPGVYVPLRALFLVYNLITFSYASTLLKTMHDSGRVQILIILHVFCVVPGNKHN